MYIWTEFICNENLCKWYSRGITLKILADVQAIKPIYLVMDKVKETLNLTHDWYVESGMASQALDLEKMKSQTDSLEKVLNETDIKVALYNGHLSFSVNLIGE